MLIFTNDIGELKLILMSKIFNILISSKSTVHNVYNNMMTMYNTLQT